MSDAEARTPYDVLVVGGGPAGLSAALNLGRSMTRVLVVDADRPRNAATLSSHGFLTRDGIPPHDLRRLAREELAAYPSVEVLVRQRVFSLRRADGGFEARAGRREPGTLVSAATVLLAAGLRETLPDVPGLIDCYGVSAFSCAACDGWELRGRRLALIGQSADLAERARLISRFGAELTVFTHGADVVGAAAEQQLAMLGAAVVRTPLRGLQSERGMLRSAVLADGRRFAVDGAFVRPEWTAELAFLDGIAPAHDAAGHLAVDAAGRTSEPGVYAAGDVASPGPQQLIVAAGAGARTAALIVHDALGVVTAH